MGTRVTAISGIDSLDAGERKFLDQTLAFDEEWGKKELVVFHLYNEDRHEGTRMIAPADPDIRVGQSVTFSGWVSTFDIASTAPVPPADIEAAERLVRTDA